MTTLIIARHGNTFEAGQVPTRVGARTNLQLTSSGEEQALRLGLALKNTKLIPHQIYTSQLQRTVTTARLACVSMQCAVVPETLPFLNEIDYGPDENKIDELVIKRIGKNALTEWDASGAMPEGWSPRPEVIIAGWKTFLTRMQTEFAGKRVLLVTSNGVARFVGECTVNGHDFPLKLATGSYGVVKTTPEGKWQMTEWNTQP